MKILSIETASEICSVAILENKKIIKELHIKNGNTHSQNLMPLISQILEETKLTINDIDLFACDNGPGSFTGIRIGIATLKAFRDITLKPIIGVSSLKSLAYNLDTDSDFICSVIDAKNDNVYYGVFKKDNNTISEFEDYKFASLHSMLDFINKDTFLNKKIFFVGNGSIAYKDVIKSKLINRALFENDASKNDLNAINIASIAIDEFNNKLNLSDICPLYLKKSSAELSMEASNEFNNSKNDN